MTATTTSPTITYPTTGGRGAWSRTGIGGTLDTTGRKPGPLYRAPAPDAEVLMPGLAAVRAILAGKPLSIDEYAVFAAVRAIQTGIAANVDGIFGSHTASTLQGWQRHRGLVDDGQFGPASAVAMFLPMVNTAVNNQTSDYDLRTSLRRLTSGHIGYESSWDPGAVGATTPQDLGLGQINGPSHPTLTADQRLNPKVAISYTVSLVQTNLEAMDGNERDAVAAYNLGVAGAKEWVRLDRPIVWKGRAVRAYIDGVLAAAQ